MKIRKQLKRILALFLIVIMASTSTSLESFAAETIMGQLSRQKN